MRRETHYLAWTLMAVLTVLYPAGRAVAPKMSAEQQLQVAVATTLHHNLIPRHLIVYPSHAYYNTYLRDSFWALQALGDARYSIYELAQFAANERADGDPPTWFGNVYRFPHYHDDESAALLLIWAWRNNTLYGIAPPRPALQRALSYLLKHSRDGYYQSPPGPYASWWDAYRWRRATTLSYNQGLYAVALRCAAHLGLRLPPHAIGRAEQAYRALYNPALGYIPVSRSLPASDASALTGEFLSLWLFKHPMLTDAIVLHTFHHLTPFESGFRVVALPGSGTWADAGGFFSPNRYLGLPGDYQNGASWLLYDALTVATAGMHGLRDARARLHARLAMEFRHGVILHEYLQTNPQLPYYEGEPSWRDAFSWDAFVLVIDGIVQDLPTVRDRGKRSPESARRES